VEQSTRDAVRWKEEEKRRTSRSCFTHINTHTRTCTSCVTWTMTTLLSTASTAWRAPRITTCRNPALVVLDTERAGGSVGARARAQVRSWHKAQVWSWHKGTATLLRALCLKHCFEHCDSASRRASSSKVKESGLASRRFKHAVSSTVTLLATSMPIACADSHVWAHDSHVGPKPEP
jgi:hypothetical protein